MAEHIHTTAARASRVANVRSESPLCSDRRAIRAATSICCHVPAWPPCPIDAAGLRRPVYRSAAPLAVTYVRARVTVPVLVLQPAEHRQPPRRVMGRLVGGTFVRGVLHHCRVVDEAGGLFLAHPEWIEGGAPQLVWCEADASPEVVA